MPKAVPSQEAFIHAAMAVLQKNQTDLGSVLGFSNAYGWAHARLRPDTPKRKKAALKYPEAMAILYEAGWLTEDARQILAAAQAAVAASKASRTTRATRQAEAVQQRLSQHPEIRRLRRRPA